MTTTMSVFCLVESKASDQKSGAEFGDAVFKMESYYEKFKWKVFYNTRKGSNSRQCQPFNENDIVHMFGKFTFIKVDGVETLALVLSSAFTFKRSEGGNLRNDLPDQAPVLSFFARPVPNSHQNIDGVNCLKSTVEVYNAYNNQKTKLNFGIFYTVIKNRWTNISTQWANDKLFHIVGHYTAARQNYITVNATEIDYEDVINKSSNDQLISTSSNPQSEIINKFFESLTPDQHLAASSSSTQLTTNQPNDTSYETAPSSIMPNTITSTTSSIPITQLQHPNQLHAAQLSNPQFYQPVNPTNLTFSSYSQFPHSSPTYYPILYNQPSSNLAQNTPAYATTTSQHIQPTLPSNKSIIIEDTTQKKGKKRKGSKNKLSQTPVKTVKTRSDTKTNKNSEVMDLALTSLHKESEATESEDSAEDNMQS